MQGIHVFMNGERGRAIVERLVASGHGVNTVYLPTRTAAQYSVLDALEALGLDVVHVDDPNEPAFVARLVEAAPTLIAVAGFSTIFRAPFLNAAPNRIINLHAGALPKYRGGSPLNWQLIMGEKAAGVSVIRMDDGIDTGNILADARFPISGTDTIADLHDKANALFPDLVLKVVIGLEYGSLDEVTQPQSGTKYWHQRNDGDGRIDWATRTADEIERFIRALGRPYPGAFSYLGEARVRLWSAHLPDTEICGQPGRVCYIAGQGPYVLCTDRALLITDYDIERQANDGNGSTPSRLPNGAHLL